MDCFVADLHLGHRRIIQFEHRPFLCPVDRAKLDELGGRWHDGVWKRPDSPTMRHRISDESVALMDANLLGHCRKMASPKRRLVIAGDFTLRGPEACRRYREELGGWSRVILVRGNHDDPRNDEFFDEVYDGNLLLTSDSGRLVVVDHYFSPFFNKHHKNACHAFGHSHGGINDWIALHCPDVRAMDVGVDPTYRRIGEHRPLLSSEFFDLLKDRPGHYADHHRPIADAPDEHGD